MTYLRCLCWPIMGKHDVIHKTGSTYRIALSSEENRGNMYLENLLNFRHVVLRCATDASERTYRQAYRHADRNISHPAEGRVAK